MDTQMLGTTTMKLMDSLDELQKRMPDAEIAAVGIVVCVQGTDEDGDPATFERVFFSDTMYYRQVGLLSAGLEAVHDAKTPDDEEATGD